MEDENAVLPNDAHVDFSIMEGLAPSFRSPNDSDESNDSDDCRYDLATKKRRALYGDDEHATSIFPGGESEEYKFGAGGGDCSASSKFFVIRGDDEEDHFEVAAPPRGSRDWIVGVDCG